MKPAYHSPSFWFGMLATVIIVVTVRETALYICTLLKMPTAANIVGLVTLFLILMVCQRRIAFMVELVC